MKEHVALCKIVTVKLSEAFNSLWITMAIFGIEKYIIPGPGYMYYFLVTEVIIGFGILMGFIDSKKNIIFILIILHE